MTARSVLLTIEFWRLSHVDIAAGSPEIITSINFLTNHLQLTSKNLFRSTGVSFPPFQPPYPLLDERLLEAGWCLSDIHRLTRGPLVLGKYFASFLKRSVSGTGHRTCTSVRCIANNIDESTYRIRHSCLRRDCKFIGPLMQELSTLIECGDIPIIAAELDDASVRLSVAKYLPGLKYVAISHVWSDGLGNPRENTLPTCELQNTVGLIRRIYKTSIDGLETPIFPHRAGVYFWMDTLCVPVSNVYRNLRKKAIQQMRLVY